MKAYIGHGVYAKLNGANIILTTEECTSDRITNEIVLDPDAVDSLMIYINMIKDARGEDDAEDEILA